MSASVTDPERTLRDAYLAMADRYARARPILEILPAGFGRGEDCTTELEQLRTLLDEAAAIDAGVAGVREIWRTSGRRPGPELKAALDLVADHLVQLTELNRATELAANAHRNRLEPQLDLAVRGQQMHRAYTLVMSARQP